MLAGDFYLINDFQNEANMAKAVLELNVAHAIFAGHFPQHPVVPGVCMMQMIKDLTEHAMGNKLDLVRADEMKFLSLIDPVSNNIIQAELKYAKEESGKIKVTASLLKDALIHFKFKGSFIQQRAL
ncbi:MAG: 3-hydroxyacyl-ACP dehydratase [Ferruginibacter sp.]